MWGYLERALNGSELIENGEIGSRILECYKEIDRVIGGLLDKAGEDTTVFVISDHGFCGVRRMVHVNDWLAGLGFLTYQTGKKAIRVWARRPMNALKRVIPRAVMSRGRRTFDVLRVVDWSRTKVYLRAFTENALCINLRGREPQGIVEPGAEYEDLRQEMKRLLENMKGPGEGRPVMKHVWLREELYHGPCLAQAPDLLFELNEGYAASSEPSRSAFVQDVSDSVIGDHAPEGILIAAGAGVKKGETVAGAALIDLAPTILFALGMDIPSDMDGKVLQDLFEPDFLEKRSIRYSASIWGDQADLPEEVYSIDEEADVRAKLQGLGYL
jgi:predicted AlkP superfamily phosphohydrolase/phosphomutase